MSKVPKLLTAQLFLFNDHLRIICPSWSINGLTKLLRFQKKTMVPRAGRQWEFQVKRQWVPVHEVESKTPAVTVVRTYAGLLDDVVSFFKEAEVRVDLTDHSTKLPEPKFDLMHGMRFEQDPLLRKGLLHNKNGLFEVVTRYGKSYMILNTIRAYPGLKTVVLAPGIDLLRQTHNFLKENLPDRDVVGLYSGCRNRTQGDDITVCSMDSMHLLDKPSVQLLLPDEPHAVVSDSRAVELAEFPRARILGFGATVDGRWGGEDILIKGLIGPTLARKTYTEAVKEGAITPIHVHFIRVPFAHFDVGTRRTAYKKLVFENPKLRDLVTRIQSEVIPDDWQTLMFINQEKQARFLAKSMPDAVIAMDKLLTAPERRDLMERLKSGEVTRCICSNIYSTGVTIDNIRAIINCDGGGGGILSVQKPGRLAELKEGKAAGHVIDFWFHCTSNPDMLETKNYRKKLWGAVTSDCASRLTSYTKKGYKIFWHDFNDKFKLS